MRPTKHLELTILLCLGLPDTGWRPIADKGEYLRAAGLIEHYLANKLELEPGQTGYLRFHAAVLCAYEKQDGRAIAHLREASVDSMPPELPQSWNYLVKGTLGFMLTDMESVRSARDEIAAMTTMSARDSSFLEALEFLSTKEGMSYWEATAEWRE